MLELKRNHRRKRWRNRSHWNAIWVEQARSQGREWLQKADQVRCSKEKRSEEMNRLPHWPRVGLISIWMMLPMETRRMCWIWGIRNSRRWRIRYLVSLVRLRAWQRQLSIKEWRLSSSARRRSNLHIQNWGRAPTMPNSRRIWGPDLIPVSAERVSANQHGRSQTCAKVFSAAIPTWMSSNQQISWRWDQTKTQRPLLAEDRGRHTSTGREAWTVYSTFSFQM